MYTILHTALVLHVNKYLEVFLKLRKFSYFLFLQVPIVIFSLQKFSLYNCSLMYTLGGDSGLARQLSRVKNFMQSLPKVNNYNLELNITNQSYVSILECQRDIITVSTQLHVFIHVI